ncbi:hypothetical protein DYB32_000579 [Aphanomyces invadans]|uniref:Transmembrane protein n=1 Tax=Aphanomyces invadans TaxID=157072 RepID=A0A3R6VHZ2_9STRA|nr:hypothetical protein DYB32_000579 [Aphanomyces invadans]
MAVVTPLPLINCMLPPLDTSKLFDRGVPAWFTRVVLPCAGTIYLLCTVGTSFAYLIVLVEYVSNDFWWREFNTTGGQTYLADLFNAKLILDVSGPFDMFDSESAMLGNYSAINTFVNMRAVAARRWMLEPLPLDVAVTTLRKNSLYENVFTVISHCWVDFNRHFEMAHSPLRQQRCANRQQDNAAMYLESLLRNVNSSDLTESSFGHSINQTILTPMLDMAGGPAWVHQLVAMSEWLSVKDEVEWWHEHGLAHWTIQMQNRFQLGFEDSITIVNALGVVQPITVSSWPYMYRGLASWSTSRSAVGLWNDLSVCTYYGCSLVLNSNASLPAMGMDWDVEYNGPASTVGMQLIRSEIGPLMGFDLYHVRPPASVVAIFSTFQRQFLHALTESSELLDGFNQLTDPVIDVVPANWRAPNLAFYGGSPLCLSFADPQPFPQMPLAYNDGCQNQDPFVIEFDRLNVVFAMIVLAFNGGDIPAVCAISPARAALCHETLAKAATLLPLLHTVKREVGPLVAKANVDVQALRVQFMQMAVQNGSTNVLVTQDVVPASSSDPWSLMGWLTMYDWVNGTREVYNVEGDHGNLTLMSGRVPYVRFVVNPEELPRKACVYFWYLVVYSTAMSTVVAVAMTLLGVVAKFQIDGANLFQYNRIFGSVWIGRPLMFIRGITAVIILSTSTTALHVGNQVTAFHNYDRSPVERLLLSSETLWLQYVLNDVLLPLTQTHSRDYAALGSCLGFIAVMSVELASPYVAHATIERTCSITSFRRGIKCTSGTIEIGSFGRVCVLFSIHAACAVVAYCVVRACRFLLHKPRPKGTATNHALIPAATEAFCMPSAAATSWHLDVMTCIMSGMVPVHNWLFDFKTWGLVKGESATGHTFDVPQFVVPPGNGPVPTFGTKHAWLGFLSLMYMTTSIAGSYTFLELTKSAMANDFWWASFDTDTHVYVCNWFNSMLQVTSAMSNIQIHTADHAAMATTTNMTASVVAVSPLYAIAVQDAANSLANVIQGLRSMDGCMVPWIMTTYCYVDFGRRWEMAPSEQRQARCVADARDGAVYLESMVRNANLASLMQCWGDPLDVGVFSYLKTSAEGIQWLDASVRRPANTVADEERLWQSHGIATFTTQWQNFKTLGIVESFSIQNAFGWSYPITLKTSNGSFQFPVQTTFKMAWPLACDLTLLMLNTSVTSGKSLLRVSGNFAYHNVSVETIYALEGVVPSPLGPGMSLLRSVLGPFGQVKMKRVACPSALRSLYLELSNQLKHWLGMDAAIQEAFWSIYFSFTMQPVVKAWTGWSHRGGNILCEPDPNFLSMDDRPCVSFSYRGLCGIGLQDTLTVDTSGLVKAVLATPSLNATAATALEYDSPDSSFKFISNAQAFVAAASFPPDVLNSLRHQAQQVKQTLRDDVAVTVVQYVVPRNGIATNYSLARVNVFDESEADFELFAWLYMFDWVQGIREVVSFEGDATTITSMSTTTVNEELPVNPMEVPLNVAFYMRWLLQYITLVMLCVACVVCVYIVMLKGQVEAANMTSFSRVASLVWVGRPLILLRAFCAICLLSTSSLVLVRPLQGLVSFFHFDRKPWYIVILTAGELNWMTYIINDVFSVLTHQYTQKYSWTSFIVVWVASAIWEFASPASYSVVVERVCTVAQVDFQVICHGGTIEIGSVSRFTLLLGLVFGYCALCFVLVLWRFPRATTRSKTTSVFLYTSAKHQFVASKWVYQGTQYVDKASAVLTGILSVEVRAVLYLFDIKTWRIYTMPLEQLGTLDRGLPPHLTAALPLIDG